MPFWLELVQAETPKTPEPTPIIHGTKYPRVTIISSDDDDLPLSVVPEREQMLHIQNVQATRHHKNSNQISYLMNTTLHLQFGHSFLQYDKYREQQLTGT